VHVGIKNKEKEGGRGGEGEEEGGGVKLTNKGGLGGSKWICGECAVFVGDWEWRKTRERTLRICMGLKRKFPSSAIICRE
jgi:hypothetical protein